MSNLAERPSEINPSPVCSQIRAGSTWLDPVQWSWLVRSYGLFLIVTTLAEYMTVVVEVMAPWLPLDRRDEPRGVVLLVWLVLPFVFSQALGVLWMVLIARVRAPHEGPALSIVRDAVNLAAPKHSRFRSPRLLVGDIADPSLISVLGVPFLIIPVRALDGFHHALGEEDGARAFRAVMVHEMGHALLWDDILFMPSFIYLLSSVVLDVFGFGLALLNRLDWTVPITHAMVLTGLALFGRYVVRRREAFSDAFSAVTLGTERPIRDALEVLGGSNRSRVASLFASHFEPSRRLTWLDGRGRPFLDMSARDLGILALVNLTVGTSPLNKITLLSPLGHLIIGLGDGLSEIACIMFSILAIAGMMIGRGGGLPSRRELLSAAMVCTLGQTVHAFAKHGVLGLFSVLDGLAQLVLTLLGSVLPFMIIVRILGRWSLAVLWYSRRIARERLLRGAALLAGFAFGLHHGLNLALSRLGPQTALSLIGTDQDQVTSTKDFALTILSWGGAITFAQILTLLLLALWSTRVLRDARPYACRACGTSAPRAGAHPVLWGGCTGCGMPLRQEFVINVAD